jgi:hypothetical protein
MLLVEFAAVPVAVVAVPNDALVIDAHREASVAFFLPIRRALRAGCRVVRRGRLPDAVCGKNLVCGFHISDPWG